MDERFETLFFLLIYLYIYIIEEKRKDWKLFFEKETWNNKFEEGI